MELVGGSMNKLLFILSVILTCSQTPLYATKYGSVKLWDGDTIVNVSDSALKVYTDDTLNVAIADTIVVRVTDTLEVNSIPKDYYLEVAKGNVAGASKVNKFGHNPTATSGDDIWGGGGVYVFFPDTARTMEILSTSALDDEGSTGAIQVRVKGLDSNWLEIEETVTMNGTTPVSLTNKFVRMYRAFVLEVGSAETNEGDITVEIVGTDTAAIFISADEGQTQHAIYTVPEDKTAYFLKGYVSLTNSNKNGEDGTFQYYVRLNNGYQSAWLVKGEVGLVNIGSSYWQYEYAVPAGPIPGKSDIKIRLTDASATMNTQAGFDLILIDN